MAGTKDQKFIEKKFGCRINYYTKTDKVSDDKRKCVAYRKGFDKSYTQANALNVPLWSKPCHEIHPV